MSNTDFEKQDNSLYNNEDMLKEDDICDNKSEASSKNSENAII